MSPDRRLCATFLLCILIAISGLLGRASAESAPIFLDGFFTDWTGPTEWTDTAGDGVAGSVDLTDLLWTNDSRADENGRHHVQLEPYAYRWFRSRGPDRNVPR